jgi:hypothetical protein
MPVPVTPPPVLAVLPAPEVPKAVVAAKARQLPVMWARRQRALAAVLAGIPVQQLPARAIPG